MVKKEEVKRNWYVVDAKGKVLGRLATAVASILRGKNKPSFTPHVDCGDGVIVINAKDIRVTGKKMQEKIYKTYSGYPSGLKEYSMETMLKKKPEKILRIAVKGMLPKNKIADQMIRRLKVFMDDKHTHQAQTPKELKI
jgi:large subunit ribosomal protein L13